MNRKASWLTQRIGGMKLRTKLISAFLVVALVPVSVVGVYAYGYMRRAMLQRVEDGMTASIHQLQIAMTDKLERYEQVLRYLMYDYQTVGIFTDADASYYDIYYNMQEIYLPLLVTIREMNRDIARVGIYTDNPALRPRGDNVLRLSDIAGSEQAREALEKRMPIWSVQGDELVVMGAMMRMNNQVPENVAYLSVPLDAVLDYDPGDAERWAIALCDEARPLAVRTHGGFDVGEEMWFDRDGQPRKTGDVKMLLIRQSLDRADWSIRFLCPYDQLQIDMSGLVRMVTLAVLGSFSVMAAISALVSRSITSRISALNRTISQVRHGELTRTPEVAPWEKDEIADIANHFGRMMTELNEYIEINYKNQIRLQEAELKMLQAQINPHFLYNTLSMINWMALEHDEVEISEVLMQLSQFYRMMLVRGDSLVSVQDEMDNILGYLDLQMRLHEGSFDVSIDVDESLMDYRMIGMVLQPIVENAISHGIDTLRERRGKLEITGRREEDTLAFVIRDNGYGMTREQFEENLSRSSHGYGLKNVNDRLQIAYGPRYGLTMPEDGGDLGTTVKVRIPIQSAKAE